MQLGVSLILSFMMVWDLPGIAAGAASLRTSRLAPVYNAVAPSLAVFARLFGKALQCQAQIALVNTALTAAGMWALRIPGAGLLSLFVFICGFIPVAGVIISTAPIAFVALTEYGFGKLALVMLMVTGVHFVEAYGLNPAIYSAHLKLHPLLVLSVLVFAEHSLGVWGLLLAVPLTVFTLDYCIRYPSSSATGVWGRGRRGAPGKAGGPRRAAGGEWRCLSANDCMDACLCRTAHSTLQYLAHCRRCGAGVGPSDVRACPSSVKACCRVLPRPNPPVPGRGGISGEETPVFKTVQCQLLSWLFALCWASPACGVAWPPLCHLCPPDGSGPLRAAAADDHDAHNPDRALVQDAHANS